MSRRDASALLALAAIAGGACAHVSPGRAIARDTPASAATPWTPTDEARAEQKPTPPPGIPEKYRREKTILSLAEVIDIALRNNPVTRTSWAQARSAAAVLGQKRSEYYPEIDAGGNVTRQKATTFGGASTFFQTTYGPTWQNVTGFLSPRIIKFGVQYDF